MPLAIGMILLQLSSFYGTPLRVHAGLQPGLQGFLSRHQPVCPCSPSHTEFRTHTTCLFVISREGRPRGSCGTRCLLLPCLFWCFRNILHAIFMPPKHAALKVTETNRDADRERGRRTQRDGHGDHNCVTVCPGSLAVFCKQQLCDFPESPSLRQTVFISTHKHSERNRGAAWRPPQRSSYWKSHTNKHTHTRSSRGS